MGYTMIGVTTETALHERHEKLENIMRRRGVDTQVCHIFALVYVGKDLFFVDSFSVWRVHVGMCMHVEDTT